MHLVRHRVHRALTRPQMFAGVTLNYFVINGVVTTEYKDSMDASGPVGIQHHGEKGQTYKFRNLRIKPLSE